MSLSIRRVLEESLPIAAVLLLWSLLSLLAMADGRVQFAISFAGLVMAGLYSVVRGVGMSADVEPVYTDGDAGSALRENGRAVLAGGPWFALALVTAVVRGSLGQLALPSFYDGGLLWSVTGGLIQVFAVTGTLTVLLIAVASGTHTVRSVR